MKTNTVNISFKADLLEKIDETAKEESRSRSELIREAARMYIQRKRRWRDIFGYGKKQIDKLGLKQEDVKKEIKKHRKSISA